MRMTRPCGPWRTRSAPAAPAFTASPSPRLRTCAALTGAMLRPTRSELPIPRLERAGGAGDVVVRGSPGRGLTEALPVRRRSGETDVLGRQRRRVAGRDQHAVHVVGDHLRIAA